MLIKGTPAILRDSYNPMGPSGLMGLAAQGQKFLTAHPEYEMTYADLQEGLIQAANDPYLMERPWQQKEILMNYLNIFDFTFKDVAETLGMTEKQIIDFINLDTEELKKQKNLQEIYKSVLEQIDTWRTKYNRTLTEAKRLSAFSLISALNHFNYTANDLAQANGISVAEVNDFIALATAEPTGPELEVQPEVKINVQTSGIFVGGIEMPLNWGAYTPQQRISFFNENSITTTDLLDAGVPQSDIDWMILNGYTGEPAEVTKARISAAQVVAQAADDAAKAAADAAAKAAADAAAKQAAANAAAQAAAQATAQATTNAAAQAAEKAADDAATKQAAANAAAQVAATAAQTAVEAASQAADTKQTLQQVATPVQETKTNAIPLALAVAAAYFFGG